MSLGLTPNCNLKLVQFFFELVKGVVPNLVVCPHGENSLSRRVDRFAINLPVRDLACARIRRFISETCRERLSGELGGW